MSSWNTLPQHPLLLTVTLLSMSSDRPKPPSLQQQQDLCQHSRLYKCHNYNRSTIPLYVNCYIILCCSYRSAWYAIAMQSCCVTKFLCVSTRFVYIAICRLAYTLQLAGYVLTLSLTGQVVQPKHSESQITVHIQLAFEIPAFCVTCQVSHKENRLAIACSHDILTYILCCRAGCKVYVQPHSWKLCNVQHQGGNKLFQIAGINNIERS